ncbi:phenylalanine--tRNA ligase subunit beta [Candidatus Woesebacteria bacterium RIFCSPHIGHO2_02_FULL_38_9]|uniref:Phenylalanine--tRNA ligase beta subunit n=1 Tax=Candidatus Woesebacteria bacterium RIFCSPHIGHO2_01_FULL_39_28 TaxID=1802496 RepID=A0A1F7YDE3_9BACT|nr:MAG: phenylalanine--tRNA ligase subunit beta [Candidatus Woesebacteria bacterium RIFCSPHIGHO2_01_FULL_39_28]OGM32398.1 MAG: phenylalanine--tRNA ligase subunit beta [Candidatus Woesebacteria bacterium RIFCSPHIGHO2_02_FULL_38_9]OGM57895.1 MAG: phenylalanine--tRNA ligase subunit beta [Candidatus Woesebacteria bacterium RIFCSPLOWO2_01_FULL_38_20]
MLAPINWLKEYIKIEFNKDLMWEMTQAGMTTESYQKIGDDIILDIEVTPNRPDWLSVIGIAREIAAIKNLKIKLPDLPKIPNPTVNLPIHANINSALAGRYTGITISDVRIKPSPEWMQKRLKLVGLRPINNLVDITNYVMLEFGIPIHVFDYDKLLTKDLKLELSKGGEDFVSVDGIFYKLSKDAIIIKDKDRVIDLCGIKGGQNSGVSAKTKNIFIHLPVYTPNLIRRTSQALKLSSDASYIYERGANAGGTLDSLKRTLDLIRKFAGGEIASNIIDIKKDDLKPLWLTLSLPRLEKVLGIKIEINQVLSIFKRLGIPAKLRKEVITVTVPTYRGDLKIEEDLIEEIARIWSYNKFPKTLPIGHTLATNVPYLYDKSFKNKLKNLLVSAGFYETMTLSLISRQLIEKSQLNLEDHLKIANPVSQEYEYMRTTLIPSLITALKINEQENVNFFEYSKVYSGIPGKTREPYKISGISRSSDYKNIKGVIDLLCDRLNIGKVSINPIQNPSGVWHPIKSGNLESKSTEIGFVGEINPMVLKNFDIEERIVAFELDTENLKKLAKKKVFKQLPKYPPQIEDLTLIFSKETKIGEVVNALKNVDKLISNVELKDIYEDSYTFRVYYQHSEKTLDDREVEELRKKLLEKIKKEFSGKIK